MIRLDRFRRAIAILENAPSMPLARIAYRLGFADQAHFTREFAAFAGIPPTRYRADVGPETVELAAMSDSFKTGSAP
jgi:AraC-like DNA-binding protein